MAESSAEPGTGQQVSHVQRVDGVQLFGRKDAQGHYSKLDAIDRDERKIRDIADRLQHRGFGVVRRRKPRSGRVYFTLKATWIGAGEPPDNPLDGS
jgi:hypothetical protein